MAERHRGQSDSAPNSNPQGVPRTNPCLEAPVASEQHDAGNPSVTPEHLQMKICDLCRDTVTNLKPGPCECGSLETCDACSDDLLRRLSQLERRVMEIRSQLRAEAIDAWRKERGKGADRGASLDPVVPDAHR